MQRSNRNRKTAGVRLMPAADFVRYRTMRYHASSTISKEQFSGESAEFYIRPNGSRVIKEGIDYVYFKTWEEARDHALALAKHELRNAKNNIQRIESMTSYQEAMA